MQFRCECCGRLEETGPDCANAALVTVKIGRKSKRQRKVEIPLCRMCAEPIFWRHIAAYWNTLMLPLDIYRDMRAVRAATATIGQERWSDNIKKRFAETVERMGEILDS